MIKHRSLLLLVLLLISPGILLAQDAFMNTFKDNTCTCITEYVAAKEAPDRELLQTALRDCLMAVANQHEKELQQYMKKQKLEAREVGQQAGSALMKECKALASLSKANADAQATYEQASKLMKEGEHGKALEMLNQLLLLYPAAPLYFNDRGVCRENLGDLWGALADYRRAIDLEPSFVVAHYNLSNIFFQLEYYRDAAAHLKQSTTLDPQDQDYWVGLLKTYYQLQDYDSVHYFAKKALAVDTKNAAAHNYQGLVLYQQQEYATAIKHFEKAVKADVAYAAAWQNIAAAQEAMEQNDQAVATYRRYLKEVDASNTDVREDLADLLAKMEQYKEAEPLYLQLIKEQEEDNKLRLQNQLGRLYLAKKDYKQASQYYAALLLHQPDNAALLYNRVKAMVEVNEAEQALPLANQLIALEPGDAANFDLRAAVWEKLNKQVEALQDLEASQRIYPQDANVYVRKGDLLRKMGKHAEACQAYHMAASWDQEAGSKAITAHCN